MINKVGSVHIPISRLKEKWLMIPAGIVLISALLLQGTGCKKKSGNEGSPVIAHACRVSEHVDSSWGSGAVTDLQKYTHQYDDKGNETSRTYLANTQFDDGTSSTSASNDIYQYDQDGFITGQVEEGNAKNRANLVSGSNSTMKFQYDQGRMTRQSSIVNSSASTSTLIYDWAYDSKGELIKETDSGNNVFLLSIIYDYTGGILYKIVRMDASGKVNIPYIELNSQGLFTKTIDGTIETRYQYDAFGQLIRKESWVNGKAENATSWEYDNNKSVVRLEFPYPKGSPRLHYLTNNNIDPVHNQAKLKYFISDAAGQWVGNGYTQLTYQYNSQGYPLTILIESFDAQGNKLASGTKRTYSYTNCE